MCPYYVVRGAIKRGCAPHLSLLLQLVPQRHGTGADRYQNTGDDLSGKMELSGRVSRDRSDKPRDDSSSGGFSGTHARWGRCLRRGRGRCGCVDHRIGTPIVGIATTWE